MTGSSTDMFPLGAVCKIFLGRSPPCVTNFVALQSAWTRLRVSEIALRSTTSRVCQSCGAQMPRSDGLLDIEFNGSFKHEHPELLKEHIQEIETFARVSVPSCHSALHLTCRQLSSPFTLKFWTASMYFLPSLLSCQKTISPTSTNTK